MDGTLIDTEPYWMAEERALVHEAGGQWSDTQALQLVGNDLLTSAEILIAHSPVTLTPHHVVERLLTGVVHRTRRRLPWQPGARELLLALHEHRVPCALVTMSYRPLAQVLLEELPPGLFRAVITGDEVTRGKPDPEPYVLGARALGLAPGDCIAIEDSPPGVTSAVGAGVPTVAVPHAVPLPEMGGAVRVRTLAGLGPQDLVGLTERLRTAAGR